MPRLLDERPIGIVRFIPVVPCGKLDSFGRLASNGLRADPDSQRLLGLVKLNINIK